VISEYTTTTSKVVITDYKTYPSSVTTKNIVTTTLTAVKVIPETTVWTAPTTTDPEETDDSHCAEVWAQCGGINFNGPNCCKTGLICVHFNPYYYQCVYVSS